MTLIHAYLTFDGNCREAMEFYHDCLGGELKLQELNSIPAIENISINDGRKILHASLRKDGLILMASDMTDREGVIKGNAISLALNCSSNREIRDYFDRLSRGGQITDPLKEQFWGSLFGSLIDRYGVNWLLNYEQNREN